MAAGLGYKEFTTGDVLTAADANGYLASQVVMVFASAAARTSAIASPQEGMISYLKDTNSTEYYSGSAWVAISGGSAGALVYVGGAPFSASSSQSLNNIFTSTYQNYLVVVNIDSVSTAANINLRMRASGTDSSASYYNNILYNDISAGSASFGNIQVNNGNTWKLADANSSTHFGFSFNLFSPQQAKTTTLESGSHGYLYGAVYYQSLNGGVHAVASAYDGLTIFPASGTMTGNIRVYGYANS
jgi:hypothetical protein